MRFDQHVHMCPHHAQSDHVAAFLARDGAQIAIQKPSGRRVQERLTASSRPDDVKEQARAHEVIMPARPSPVNGKRTPAVAIPRTRPSHRAERAE
jgi:hypothetical protein